MVFGMRIYMRREGCRCVCAGICGLEVGVAACLLFLVTLGSVCEGGEGEEEDKGLVSFVCNVVGRGESGGVLHSRRSVRSAVV